MVNCDRKFQLTRNSTGRSGREKKILQDIAAKGPNGKKLNLWSGKQKTSVKSHDNQQISLFEH